MKNNYLFFILLFASSCSNQNSRLVELNILSGTWVSINGESTFTETWSIINDTLLTATSVMKVGNEIAFSEKIKLVLDNDSIYYIPAVSNQNNGNEIRFSLISKTAKEWIFENKTHDFPTQIIYKIKEKDSLIVKVNGIEHGRQKEYVFRLKKIKKD